MIADTKLRLITFTVLTSEWLSDVKILRFPFINKNMNLVCSQILHTSKFHFQYSLQFVSFLFNLLFIINCCHASENIAVLANDVSTSEKKFLIYDVNYGEGFNLRRDVFMR